MVAKKMERVLLIMWFVSLVFVCIIGYRNLPAGNGGRAGKIYGGA